MKRPFDVEPSEYPFGDHWLPYRDGFIHYVDEGRGPAVLLLHGNPTWSYLYRNVIKELRADHRLVALDYPGFGMSKAPSGYAFTPQEQAHAVEHLIGSLDLKDFVLVVQDWGGPIGMSYAVQHKENLRGIVVMNSWAWPASVPQRLFSLVMGGWPIGYWLQTGRNFFAKVIVPRGIHHSEKDYGELEEGLHGSVPDAGVEAADLGVSAADPEGSVVVECARIEVAGPLRCPGEDPVGHERRAGVPPAGNGQMAELPQAARSGDSRRCVSLRARGSTGSSGSRNPAGRSMGRDHVSGEP